MVTNSNFTIFIYFIKIKYIIQISILKKNYFKNNINYILKFYLIKIKSINFKFSTATR